ncbi:MAG: hypothetical protein U1E76_13380 [Planctomycetota bacterium]
MVKSTAMANTWNGVGFIALCAVLVGCQDLPSRELRPVDLDPLPETRLLGTIAVVTFEDTRPQFERGLRKLNHYLDLEEIDPRSDYWAFHEGLSGNLTNPNADRALGGERARYTGEASFLWKPFPWAGTVAPRQMEIRDAISDYVASMLDRRHLADRVVRSSDPQGPGGVRYVLTGYIDHFVGILSELVPPPHPELYPGFDLQIQGQTALRLKLREAASGNVLWEGAFTAHTEFVEMSERVKYYNPTDFWRFHKIFVDHFDYWAFDSMTYHAERALKQAVQDALKDLEGTLAPDTGPLPPPESFDAKPTAPPAPPGDQQTPPGDASKPGQPPEHPDDAVGPPVPPDDGGK